MREPDFHIVFQAYGNEQNLQECLFALLSFSRVHSRLPDNWAIHIYTDRPEWFGDREIGLPLIFHHLDAAVLRDWRGRINFVHRVKIALLQDLAAQSTGMILYVDSDICFQRHLQPLADRMTKEAALFMHIAEGRPSEAPNPVLGKLKRFLDSNDGFLIAGKQRRIDPGTMMWNAGVLGFPAAAGDMLSAVMAFTDTVYPRFPKHVVEQFAFSCLMQERGTVHSAAPYILHYWNFKEFRICLAAFFDFCAGASWEEQVRLSDMLPLAALIQEKLGFYRNRSILDKIRGRHFRPQLPDWAAAAEQL